MVFCDWDGRPAVLSDDAASAFAVLKRSAPWTEVDAWDVAGTAGVMSEADWRARFETSFGPLDASKLFQEAPISRVTAE